MSLFFLFLSVAASEIKWTFKPVYNRPANEIIMLDNVPGCEWRGGLSHDFANQGGKDSLHFPLWAFPVLKSFSKQGDDTGQATWTLSFPLKGVKSALELIKPISVNPGSAFKFSVRAESNVEANCHCRFRIGIFWEDSEGKLITDEITGPVVTVGRWLKGPFPLHDEVVECKVPRRAFQSRPYMFFDCPPEDLNKPGGVWVRNAYCTTGTAIKVKFKRDFLMFPFDDKVDWQLLSSRINPGSYYVGVTLQSLESKKIIGSRQYAVFVSEDGQLKCSDTLKNIAGEEFNRGGRYKATFRLYTSVGETKDTVVVVIAKSGIHLNSLAGENTRFILDFSLLDLRYLFHRNILKIMKQEIPIYYVRISLDSKDIKSGPGIILPLLKQFKDIGWYVYLSKDALTVSPCDIAGYCAELKNYVAGWEIEGGKDFNSYLTVLYDELRKKKTAVNLRFGSRKKQFPWAEFYTTALQNGALEQGRKDLEQKLEWVELKQKKHENGNDILKQVLSVLANGITMVMLPNSRKALVHENLESFSPTALYGPWITMEQILGNKVFKGKIPKIAGVESYCFRNEDGEIVAIYSKDGSPIDVKIKVLSEVTEIDLWGNVKKYQPHAGVIKVKVTGEVKFYIGLSPGLLGTINSLLVKEAYNDDGQDILELGMRNYLDNKITMTISEKETGEETPIELSASSMPIYYKWKITPELSKFIKLYNKVDLNVSIASNDGKIYQKDLVRDVFWGKKNFMVSKVKSTGEEGNKEFDFVLTYLGTKPVRVHQVLVVEKSEESIVRFNKTHLVFQPQENRTFRGRFSSNLKFLDVIVFLRGNKRPEEYKLSGIEN